MNPAYNWMMVKHAASSLAEGQGQMNNFPGLLKKVLDEGCWREFVLPTGEVVVHEGFDSFLTTEPPRGLGTTMKVVERVVKTDIGLLDLIDQVLQNPPGNPGTVDNINSRPSGTGQAASLRRLRKDAPALHAEVLAGNLSPHAAMVQAGYRPKTISVPVSRAESIARALRKNLSPEVLAELRQLLDEHPADGR